MSFCEKFKRIRNRLTKIDTISLVQLCSIKLHEIENTHIAEWKGWLPWNLALLIKWSVEYGGQKYPAREATESLVTKLMNQMNDLSSENAFLGDGGIGGLQKFLRTTAFQQFWYQTRLNSWELSRQYLLFCEVFEDHPIQKNFITQRGLDTRKFLELCLLLWTWLGKNEKNIAFKPSVLSSVSNYSIDEITIFLNSISLTLENLRLFLKERKQRIENPYLQLTEVTPLITYPLLRDENETYLVYSRRIFERTISSIFYDTTKCYGGSPLSEQFSVLFERYIGQNISSLPDKYFTEAELSKEFIAEKITDFLLPFDDCTVMLEAKAIEMRPTVQVNPGNRQLERELNENVVKAVFQGFSLANEISKKYDKLAIPNRTNYFLLVVTYRDLFLGGGQDLWEEFLGGLVTPFLNEKQIDQKLIPPDHIVVLSIDDLDLLLSVVMAGLNTIPNILKEMVKNNSDRSTMKYSFSMHLDSYQKDNLKLPTHEKVFDKMFDGLIGKIKK